MPAESLDYLSDEWVGAADDLLRSVVLDPPLDGPPISIETIVTEAPAGPTGYVVELRGSGATARRRGPDEATTLRLTQRYATAAAVARGDLSAQAAFLSGEIGLGGDVGVLISHAGLVAGMGDVLAPLRARTRFEDG